MARINIFIALVLAAALAHGDVLDREQVHTALDNAAGHMARMQALVQARDSAALATYLIDLDADSELPGIARTALLHQGLVAAGGVPPHPALRPLLQRHAAAGEALRVWHDDEGHRVAVRMYDTAAAARYAMREWRRHAAGTEARAGLERGTLTLASVFGPGGAADGALRAGYADAIAQASTAQLTRMRDEIDAALRAGWPVERIAMTAVVRLGDRGLAASLLRHGHAGPVIRMLPEISGAFPPPVAAELLTGATDRDAIASAAIAQLGRLAPQSPGARNWLLTRLDDRTHGVPAATALARHADANLVASVGERLRDDAHPLAQTRAVLALHLSGRDDARALLAEFAAEPSAPAHLRHQVEQWLR